MWLLCAPAARSVRVQPRRACRRWWPCMPEPHAMLHVGAVSGSAAALSHHKTTDRPYLWGHATVIFSILRLLPVLRSPAWLFVRLCRLGRQRLLVAPCRSASLPCVLQAGY